MPKFLQPRIPYSVKKVIFFVHRDLTCHEAVRWKRCEEIDLEAEDVEAKVSRKHAVITRSGTSVTLEDVGSLNGTFVNREDRLEEGNRHELKNGDEVIIGKVFFVFESDIE